MVHTSELLSGTCRQLRFSPKGGIEGVLLADRGRTVQVSLSADEAGVTAMNGVVLDTGEFIPMRPHGMATVGLGVGAKVRAVGEERMTLLGSRMLEARQVNGIDLG